MISSLVVKLDEEQAAGLEVLQRLNEDSRVSVGELQGQFLPLVTDVAGVSAAMDLARSIERLPGVLRVDLVQAHFEVDEADDNTAWPSRERRHA